MTTKILFIMFNLIILTNILLLSNFHPITFLFSFIIFTLSSSLIIFMNTNLSIYSFMILISLIGGMMIMFNYFISLINNENLKIKFFELMFSINLIFISFMIMFYLNYTIPKFLFMNNNNINFKIHNIFLYPLNYLTIIMIMFLLICLTISFKMSTIKMMPLRKIKN